MFTKKTKIILIALLFLIPASYFSYRAYTDYQRKIFFEKRKAAWSALQNRLTAEINRFKGQSGVVIKDMQTGWVFFHNEGRLFPSASLAKIPIMAACFLAADQGKINLTQNIALKLKDKLSGSGVLKDMPPGKSFTVEELIGLMICDSDNTATNMLTSLIGIDYLNNAFASFGLKDTNLSRRVADYYSRDKKGIENFTTARDMAVILEKIYRKKLINKDISERCLNVLKLTKTNSRIPKYLPPEITVAHKTGLERRVCHDVGIVYTCSGDFIICVLTKHATRSSAPAKKFIAKLALHTYSYFEE